MLVIRLTRTGKAHDPHYRIVVQEKRSKLNGKSIDIVGHYHPAHPGKQLVVDQDKVRMWLAKGAQSSDTVTNLLVKVGVLDASKKVHNFYTPKPKEDAPAAEKAPAVAAEVPEEVMEEAAVAEEVAVAEEAATETEAEEDVTAEEATPEEDTKEEDAAAPADDTEVAEEATPETEEKVA